MSVFYLNELLQKSRYYNLRRGFRVLNSGKLRSRLVTPFVGRGRVEKTVKESVDRGATPIMNTVVVVGARGVGKSTMVASATKENQCVFSVRLTKNDKSGVILRNEIVSSICADLKVTEQYWTSSFF